MEHEMLLEIGTEEIPAGFIFPALDNLRNLFADRLQQLDLRFKHIETKGTPRRLTVWIDGLIDRQPDKRDEIIGPPKAAAFDQNGNPTRAAEGFAQTKGVSLDELQVITTPKGEYLMVVIERKGTATADLLRQLIPQIVRDLPFPKSMRWGSGKTSFARPIQWLLALYNGQGIPFSIDAMQSGRTTKGHRFMAPQEVTVRDYKHYLEILTQKEVLVDIDQRREAVVRSVEAAAASIGGTVLPDAELVDTVCNLVEKPFPVCGTFEERFLALPQEVLITSMREHQKYFAVVDKSGKLFPNFIAVNATKVKDLKLAAEGHQRVIRARLEDALFFFNEDKQQSLEERTQKLGGIVFQRKLGTMLEKTARITSLSGWLAEQFSPQSKPAAERAAYLAKADLLTEMVNEFPSLQGVMGREYARLQGENEEVATAIQEHYMPIRAGGQLPKNTTGAIVSLADRMDTVAGCFGIGETPSGTADPFGLRRLTIGLLYIIENQNLSLSLGSFIDKALSLYGDKVTAGMKRAKQNIIAFIQGRFVNDLNARGFEQGTVEAAVSIGFDDPLDCRRRIEALRKISGEKTFTLLAGSFKRVKNIIRDHENPIIKEELLQESAEKLLYEKFTGVSAAAAPLVADKDYEAALQEILKMKEPIDAFFDQVMVMCDDTAMRNNRLALLTAIARLFLGIGDFSKMSAAS
jgi:glycyl-tRNA synthetase beta chain